MQITLFAPEQGFYCNGARAYIEALHLAVLHESFAHTILKL